MCFGGVVKLEFWRIQGDQGEAGKGKLVAGEGELDARSGGRGELVAGGGMGEMQRNPVLRYQEKTIQ